MMNKNDYFDKICCKHTTVQGKIAALLFARGYLIWCNNDRYYLSPKAGDHELQELNKTMVQFELGQVENGRLVVSDEASLNQAKLLFSQQRIGGEESWPRTCSWAELLDYHPSKLPETAKLEPFIALYVKAINLCGVKTVGCCDGNHPGKRCAFLQFYGEPFRYWHSFIREYFLRNASNLERRLNWNSKTDKLIISENTRFESYYALYKEACFFLLNHELIISVKDEILSNFSADELNSNDNSSIISAFQEYLAKDIKHSLLSTTSEEIWF